MFGSHPAYLRQVAILSTESSISEDQRHSPGRHWGNERWFGAGCSRAGLSPAMRPGPRTSGAADLADVVGRNVLGDERRLLAAVVDSADDAICTKDLSGTILSWNHAAEKIFGYSEAEMVGKSVGQIVPPDKRAELADILRRVAGSER